MDLKRRSYIHVLHKDDSYHYSLTKKGHQRLKESIIDELEIPFPNQWDKKWRLVTFDVPVEKSRQRAYFTARLQSLGFMMMQRSLWVYPFPCFEQLEQIAGHYHLLGYCSLMEVQKLDEISIKRLLAHFSPILSRY